MEKRKETDKERITRELRDKLPPEVLKALAKGQRPARAVKPSFRHVIEFDWFREFTLLERLKILIGYNLEVTIRIPTVHKPGELGVLVMADTSRHKTAKSMLAERAKLALSELYGNQLPIEHNEKTSEGI